MRRQIYVDFIRCIDPGDRAYFRRSREAQLGMTLEQCIRADRDAALPDLLEACAPLERTLSEQPFLAGAAPAYIDYVVFSVFQWARIGSPRDVLEAAPLMAATRGVARAHGVAARQSRRSVCRLSNGGHMISYDLKGKTALVTGGASGIGFATARMLTKFGATVAVNFLADDPRGPEAVDKLNLDFSNAADIYSVNEAVSGCFQHAKAATRAYGGIFHLSRAMRVRRLCLSRHAGGRRHVSWLGRRCPGCLTWAAPTQS